MSLDSKRFGLITKISIFVGVIELIVFSLMTLIYVSQYSKFIEEDIHSRLKQINKMVANEELPISSLAQVNFMSSMIGKDYLEGLVVGNNGIVIVSSDTKYLGKSVNNIATIKQDWLLKIPGEKFIVYDDKLISIAFLNNEYTTTPLYQTIITISTQKIKEIKQYIITIAIVGTLFFILLSTLGISLFAKYFVTNRILESLETLKIVENGDINARIEITDKDELGFLQGGINSMIDKVSNLLKQYQKSTQEVKEINKQLDVEKAHYKKLLESASDGIHVLDINGNLVQWSSSFREMLGYEDNEMKSLNVSHWDDFVPHERLSIAIQDLMRKDTTFETIHKRKDGTRINVQISAKGIILDGKEYLYASARDITEKIEAQEKILEQKEEFETIFNYSQDGIVIIDLETNFLTFNDAFIRFTGYSEEELLQLSCKDLIDEQYRKTNEEALRKTIEIGFIENVNKECNVKNRNKVPVNMSMSLLPDKKRILISLKDMTAVKMFESQAKLASMGEMIGNIAHQWRQPLSVITTSATGVVYYKDMGKLNDEFLTKQMNLINNQAQYLSKTIDDFRDFIKGEVNLSKFSIIELLQSSINLVHASLTNHYITLVKNLEDDLIIEGSRNELEQALINIFNNAKDVLSKKADEDKVIIVTTKKIDDKSVEITIQDSGGGIDEEIIDRIFEPYFTTKHKSQGTGLGLAMVDKIIRERHHQQLSVHNERFIYKNKEYVGAKFRIVFSLDTEAVKISSN